MEKHFFNAQIIFLFIGMIIFTSCSSLYTQAVEPDPTPPILSPANPSINIGNGVIFTDSIDAPTCVKQKMPGFMLFACKTGAQVKEYEFQNQKVYVFDPGNCGADMAAEVTDVTAQNWDIWEALQEM